MMFWRRCDVLLSIVLVSSQISASLGRPRIRTPPLLLFPSALSNPLFLDRGGMAFQTVPLLARVGPKLDQGVIRRLG